MGKALKADSGAESIASENKKSESEARATLPGARGRTLRRATNDGSRTRRSAGANRALSLLADLRDAPFLRHFGRNYDGAELEEGVDERLELVLGDRAGLELVEFTEACDAKRLDLSHQGVEETADVVNEVVLEALGETLRIHNVRRGPLEVRDVEVLD